MNISSLIVRSRPEALVRVRRALEALSGVEIHTVTEDGRIVLTLEDSDTGSAADAFVKIHDVDGVLAASMVYQYCD